MKPSKILVMVKKRLYAGEWWEEGDVLVVTEGSFEDTYEARIGDEVWVIPKGSVEVIKKPLNL